MTESELQGLMDKLNFIWRIIDEEEPPTPDIVRGRELLSEEFAAFFSLVKSLDADPNNWHDAMKNSLRVLSVINSNTGNILIQTDEREVIVPFYIDLIRDLGVDVANFRAGDPTLDYRDF